MRRMFTLSRCQALLMCLSDSYLIFQLFTHSFHYKPQENAEGGIIIHRPPKENVFRVPTFLSTSSRASDDGETASTVSTDSEDDDVHQPKLKVKAALILLLVSSTSLLTLQDVR